MTIFSRFLVGVFCVLVSLPALGAGSCICGEAGIRSNLNINVTDHKTKEPIKGVFVELQDVCFKTNTAGHKQDAVKKYTDADGDVFFYRACSCLHKNNVKISFSHKDYKSVTITLDKNKEECKKKISLQPKGSSSTATATSGQSAGKKGPVTTLMSGYKRDIDAAKTAYRTGNPVVDALEVVSDATGNRITGVGGGCTLEFKPNGNRLTKLEHVYYVIQGGECVNPGNGCTQVKWFMPDITHKDDEGHDKPSEDAKFPFLYDLIKVNGKSVDPSPKFENSDWVLFECDKRYYGGSYLAIRSCVKGYHGENVFVNSDGIEYYDKCVKDETAEQGASSAATATATSGQKKSTASDVVGGCTLEFKPNGNRLTKLEHVNWGDQDGICVNPGVDCTQVNWSHGGDWILENGSKLWQEADSPFFNDLIKINGESVDVAKILEHSYQVRFKCDKYGESYLAVRSCAEGYHGEKALSVDDGDTYYEKCVKDETTDETAEQGASSAATATATSGQKKSTASDEVGDCTLEFKSNGDRLTKLEHVNWGNQKGICVGPGDDCTQVDWSRAGEWGLEDDYKLWDEADSPFFNDLIKINGESVDVAKILEHSYHVWFKCDKYGESYLAVQSCVKGYHGEKALSVDRGITYYDKCVKDEAGTDGSQGDAGTETNETSGDDANNSGADETGTDNSQDDGTETATTPDNAEAIADAEKAYDAAHEKETSLANRMLGGATMAATGIGGMQLAQGLAEQSADKAADRDMQAYLSTFTCRIGDKGGKSYKGGEMGIGLTGGNQLTSLYQQYVDLAADLKERKNALGMAPGIESTVVMDKANMGLYDDTGRGIENGTYASLYRASKGNDADKQKLSDQKDTSGNRVKYGAIAAGVGAVGSIVGNAIINGDDDDDDDIDLSKNGLDNFGYNLDGTCVRGKNESVAVTNNKCDSLTKRGTWWTSFSYGTVYGDAKCGTKAESPDKKQIPCSCKVTAVGDKKIDKAEWVYFASMNNDAGCKHACAMRCASSVSENESLRKKVLDSVDKKDSKLGAGLAGLGASLGSSLGSSVNLENVASMASGLMKGSGQ